MLIEITKDDIEYLKSVKEHLLKTNASDSLISVINKIINYKPKTLEDVGYKKIEERKYPYHILYENDENNSIHFYDNKRASIFSSEEADVFIALANTLQQ